MKIHLIVGARPNFMKMAPLYDEFKKRPDRFEVKLIHTGQHYDERMSKFFFDDLGMPVPDDFLDVGSASHAVQTARIMVAYEEVVLRDRPDWIIVAGDVNSTAACAIVGVKLHVKVAHLEAGLRSGDRRMPEEINRLVTDTVSDLLLTPSLDANENLMREGVPSEKIRFVGNIMIDSLRNHRSKFEKSNILRELKLDPKRYILVTLHRPSNVDSEENLKKLLNIFRDASDKLKIVFPIHPRTKNNMERYNLLKDFQQCTMMLPPLGYLDFMKLQTQSKLLITDSGGLQEESTVFGIPCLTVRENTERPITIKQGTNQLVPLDERKIIDEIEKIMDGQAKEGSVPEKWDGKTASRIVKIFLAQ